MSYKSPIEIYVANVVSEFDGAVMKACQKVYIEVDKEELIKALEYDRGQYEKGFKAGLHSAEAIPVEWINKYTNEHRTYMHAFSEMVACWYDEKENREYEMASDMRDYCEKYEPTYNHEDGSL